MEANNPGSLKDELESLKAEFFKRAPENFKLAYTDHLRAMKVSSMLDLALKKGDKAPDFSLPDANGQMVSSVDLRSGGPIVVVFFRGNWCAVCNTTLKMLRKYSPHFKARSASVVAISPLSVEESAKTVRENGLDFPVLSDTNSQYSQLLNIAFVLDEKLREIYPDLASYNGDDSYILPIPAAYVFDTDGTVTYSFLETDHTKRAEPVDILNALPPLKTNRRRSLNDNIQFELARMRDQRPHHILKTMHDEIERLKRSNVEASALRAGNHAPDFRLYSKEGYLMDSRKLRKHGPLVVVFYHGLESPLCQLALESLQKYLARFEAKGATVLAISPGYKLGPIAPVISAKFPLLVDVDNEVAIKFGVSNKTLNCMGAEPEERVLPLASTFVIDRTGRIVYSFVDADHTKRAEPRTVLKAIPVEAPRYFLKRGPFSFLSNSRLAPRIRKMV